MLYFSYHCESCFYSPNITLFKMIQVNMCKSNSFFLNCCIISHYINTSYVINSPVDSSLDCFQYVATCKQ